MSEDTEQPEGETAEKEAADKPRYSKVNRVRDAACGTLFVSG